MWKQEYIHHIWKGQEAGSIQELAFEEQGAEILDQGIGSIHWEGRGGQADGDTRWLRLEDRDWGAGCWWLLQGGVVQENSQSRIQGGSVQGKSQVE